MSISSWNSYSDIAPAAGGGVYGNPMNGESNHGLPHGNDDIFPPYSNHSSSNFTRMLAMVTSRDQHSIRSMLSKGTADEESHVSTGRRSPRKKCLHIAAVVLITLLAVSGWGVLAAIRVNRNKVAQTETRSPAINETNASLEAPPQASTSLSESTRPTSSPLRAIGTSQPTQNVDVPTALPSWDPTTSAPAQVPDVAAITTTKPTIFPTGVPTKLPTRQPSLSPTAGPTQLPSTKPTLQTEDPTTSPTGQPTLSPTEGPTTVEPTLSPAGGPTTVPPSERPSTTEPSSSPTKGSTNAPSKSAPTLSPTVGSTAAPAAVTTSPSTGSPVTGATDPHRAYFTAAKHSIDGACGRRGFAQDNGELCNELCQPQFFECCDPFDEFKSQNYTKQEYDDSTCSFDQDIGGCMTYAKCQSLSGQIDPAPAILPDVCSFERLDRDPETCRSLCRKLDCCYSSGSDNCMAEKFDQCIDYSPCQNLRVKEEGVNVVAVLETAPRTLELECLLGQPECNEKCTQAECCTNPGAASCLQDNFVACLTYFPCTAVTDTKIEIASKFSAVPKPPAELVSACDAGIDPVTPCLEICKAAECCFAEGDANCFHEDPLGCIAWDSQCQKGLAE